MSEKNQIKTRLAQLASQDAREPFPEIPIEQEELCNFCGFPALACDCSRYDSEGNEL